MSKKIEEIAELLVNEINDFNDDVAKLDTINQELKETKIALDLTEFKSILESHQQKTALILNSQERILDRFEELLKNARIYPTWAVVMFIILLLVAVGALFYIYKN
jgi:hypothetical protein